MAMEAATYQQYRDQNVDSFLSESHRSSSSAIVFILSTTCFSDHINHLLYEKLRVSILVSELEWGHYSVKYATKYIIISILCAIIVFLFMYLVTYLSLYKISCNVVCNMVYKMTCNKFMRTQPCLPGRAFCLSVS